MLLTRQLVACISVLCERHTVGEPSVVRYRCLVVGAHLRLGDLSECHPDCPHGMEPQLL